jgi:hypothetical protein
MYRPVALSQWQIRVHSMPEGGPGGLSIHPPAGGRRRRPPACNHDPNLNPRSVMIAASNLNSGPGAYVTRTRKVEGCQWSSPSCGRVAHRTPVYDLFSYLDVPI